MSSAPPSPVFAPAMPGPATAPPPAPTVIPDVWTEKDLPTLGWCVGKGIAKGVAMLFAIVLVPLELLATIFAPNVLPIQFPLSTPVLIYGGGAIAIFSGASTAAQTTRLFGLMKFLSQAVKLVYLFLLAVVGIIVVGVSPISIAFGFRDLIYLFMIGTALAALAGIVTLYEDVAHRGERLPFDFPLSRRVREERQRALLQRSGAIPPEP